MELSAAEPRRKGLTALYLDGEPAVTVDAETFRQSGLRLGDELDDETLHGLLRESDARRAREKALYLLEHRSHSKKELEDKVARAAGREAAREAVSHMEELGLISDEQFARDYAAELIHRKGFAARRAEYELLQKGIDRELARTVLEELLPDPMERIASLLEGKFARSLGDEKGVRRTAAALQRMGYAGGDVHAAIRRFLEDRGETG